jgi:hypothetical protein
LRLLHCKNSLRSWTEFENVFVAATFAFAAHGNRKRHHSVGGLLDVMIAGGWELQGRCGALRTWKQQADGMSAAA